MPCRLSYAIESRRTQSGRFLISSKHGAERAWLHISYPTIYLRVAQIEDKYGNTIGPTTRIIT
jgi:hypothetical protein